MKTLIFRVVCLSISVLLFSIMFETGFDSFLFTFAIIPFSLFVVDVFSLISYDTRWDNTGMGCITWVLFGKKDDK